MILLRVFVNDFTPIKIRPSWKHRYIVNFNFAAISGINRSAGKSGGEEVRYRYISRIIECLLENDRI